MGAAAAAAAARERAQQQPVDLTGGGARARCAVVRENGASVYSASELAAAELAEVPLARRGAVSIARRLLDPLSAAFKVEPSVLGVGMYQKDLPPKELTARLDAAVEDAVATVGVDVNRASAPLLGRVAGLNKKTAAALRAHVEASGELRSRDALRGVAGIGPKTYANVAGFLRVGGGAAAAEPLDATRIHPESYADARRLLRAAAVGARALRALAAAAAASTAARRRGCAIAAAAQPRRAADAPLVEQLCDRLLAGDPRELLAPPPTLRAGAPRRSPTFARARRSSTPSSRTSRRSAASSTSASAPTGCCTRRSSARTAARSRWRRACASSSSRSTSSAGGSGSRWRPRECRDE